MIAPDSSNNDNKIVFRSQSDIVNSVILDKLTERLKEACLTMNNSVTADGRISSAVSEDIITNFMQTDVILTEKLKSYNVKITIPKSRYWYDFLISNNDNSIYIPANIKISSLIGQDNLSSKNGVLYALTGDIEASDVAGSIKWPLFWKLINKHMKTFSNADYYFLIINKNDSHDIFYTSLKTIKTLVPNGSNPPCQCSWGSNRERDFSRTQQESYEYIYDIFYKSIYKAMRSTKHGLKTLSKAKHLYKARGKTNGNK